ncbi:PREDICTED: tetratricopeptide repeat protein 38-like [Priapulus caudatus]|uniref:Tetratricopeptide repeat protein 38-like n=1 Tax=Priapulus caudatus TaxID=37621 RepID=A0ABM1ETG8_PRICU|nr:PREDICTED: tetratricopeptide repeat protein 38-like [Priapulus caudatus]
MDKHEWRGCLEWKQQNLPLSTTSEETVKLYDAFLTQWVSWRPDRCLGGLEGTAEKLLESDPNFVMGRALVNGLAIMSADRSPRLDTGLRVLALR